MRTRRRFASRVLLAATVLVCMAMSVSAGGTIAGGVAGQWSLHIGGVVGSAGENSVLYNGSLRLAVEAGRQNAIFSLNQGPETLTGVKITDTSVKFNRPIGGGKVQRYSGTIKGGASIRGTFTHPVDTKGIQVTQRWWAEREAPNKPKVTLELTYPAGKSPKVFTTGWIFGAKCIVDGKDLSSKVFWGGTGTFKPRVGATSRPSFSRAGANSILLTIGTGAQKVSKSFRVTAVSPQPYAAVGDGSKCRADAHGCPGCPHLTAGPIIQGSPHVFVRGKPAARVGDVGTTTGSIAAIHSCCGPNTFTIVAGDSDVLIDGKPAARFGDKTQHCGGSGQVCGLVMVPFSDDLQGTWTGTTTFTTVSGSQVGLKGRALPTTMVFTDGYLGRGTVVVSINTGIGKIQPMKMRYDYSELYGSLDSDETREGDRLTTMSGKLKFEGASIVGSGTVSITTGKGTGRGLMEGTWKVKKK